MSSIIYGLPLDHIYLAGEPAFSICVNKFEAGENYCLSIDMTFDQAADLLVASGSQNMQHVIDQLKDDDFTPRKIPLPSPTKIDIICTLGEPLQTLNEVICPFIPVKISPTAK
jgi:hypothetical protein